MDYKFRKVEDAHKSSIINIFNYYIENGYAAYPDKKVDESFFIFLLKMVGGYPFYMVETSQNELVGFGFFRPYQLMDTFEHTAVITYFILPEHTGKGLGTKLLSILIEDAKKAGIDNLLASISSLNQGSVNFHIKNGFIECGRFKRIGKKYGNYFDEVWMQKFI